MSIIICKQCGQKNRCIKGSNPTRKFYCGKCNTLLLDDENIYNSMADALANDDISSVIDDKLRFKIKLQLSEKAYKFLSNAKNLDAFGSALAAGLAGAAAAYVAFLASLGIIQQVGLVIGLVGQPIGWMALAGGLGALAMYGSKAAIKRFDKEALIVAPKYLNVPLDFLGSSLLNIILPLALKISSESEKVSTDNQIIILQEYSSWGYDEKYLNQMITIMVTQINDLEIDNIREKLQAISNEVNGLSYESLKEIVEESLNNIFEHKTDKSNFRVLNDVLRCL
jgi:hypothetical protein